MKFSLKITLGNAAMLTPEDIALALRKVAGNVQGCLDLEVGDHDSIRDLNGNTVGEWKVIRSR